MLLYDKHTMVEMDRLAEQRQITEERRQFAAAPAQPRPLIARKLAGWVGPLLHSWGHQLEQYSHNCPCPAPVS